MKLRVPHYYKDFVCTGTTCQDNCCRGKWGIDIDSETALYYLNLPGDIGNKLRKYIEETDSGYCFTQSHGQCAFLCDDNLCGIYKTLGPEHMGVVCTQFPRFSEYFGELKETGIGLACEEAARIIFTDSKEFSLLESELNEEYFEDSEFDEEFASLIFLLRNLYFKITASSYLTFNDKLAIMLATSNQGQIYINDDDIDGLKSYINMISGLYEDNELSGYAYGEIVRMTHTTTVDKSSIHTSILNIFKELDAYSHDWICIINDTISKFDINKIPEFNSYLNSTNQALDYDKLLNYFLFRYFAKSIFDYDILGKMRYIISSIIVIYDMNFACWINNNKFIFEDRMTNIHIFSREVEYDPDNLSQLTEDFLFEDAFNTCNLLKFIIEK